MAFLIWGISPVYWKAMQQVPALEIVTHRVVWSFFFLIGLTLVQTPLGRVPGRVENPPHPADPHPDHASRERQLAALHLGRQRRLHAAGKPRLLHQPAGERAARHGVSEGAAAAAAGPGGAAGLRGGRLPHGFLRRAALDRADPRLHLRALRLDPQGRTREFPRRPHRRDAAADGPRHRLPRLSRGARGPGPCSTAADRWMPF